MMSTTKYICPCCGLTTLTQKGPGTFEICPVCYWEDDNVQYEDPDYSGGANNVSLNQARINYKKFGAIEQRFIEQVRAPLSDEV
jgi:hypothetical protein